MTRSNRIPVTLATLLALALAACGGIDAPASHRAPGIVTDASGTFVAHELIVGYAAGTGPSTVAARLGATVKKDWPLIHAALLTLPEGLPVTKAMTLVGRQEGVRYSQPNRVATSEPGRSSRAPEGVDAASMSARQDGSSAASTPILDPQFDRQWQHRQLRSVAAWDQGATGKDIRIGIIDEFIDHRHPDLVDNIFYPGYDGYSDSLIEADTPHDGVGEHGTWVAGSAAAVGNDLGGRGVAFEADIVPLTIDDPTTGLLSTAAIVNAGLFAITGPDGVPGGDDAAPGIAGYVHVVNMSWGSDAYSQVDKDLIDLMLANGITLVASAGNTPTLGIAAPAWYPGLISVAATMPTDERTNFSNRGKHLTVAAPGESVWVTATRNCVLATPDGSSCDPDHPEVNYQFVDGTSFSSPFTAGVAALILDASADRDPDGALLRTTLTPAQVRHVLEQTARKPAGYAFDDLGHGIVDAGAAVAMAANAAAPPALGADLSVRVTLASDSSIGLGDVGVSLIPSDPAAPTLYAQTTGSGVIRGPGIATFPQIDAGTYRLVVSGPHEATTGIVADTFEHGLNLSPGSSVLVDVGLDVTLFDDPFEPNGTFDSATDVSAGRTYRASLYDAASDGDTDLYALSVTSGDSYRINLETITGTADTNLRVIASDRSTVIAENDDNQDQSTDSLVTFTAASSGTVYLEVTDLSGSNSPTNVYEMDVTTFAGDEVEPNGSGTVSGTSISGLDFGDAQAMALGSAIDASIDPADDVDIFAVSLTAGTRAIFDTEVANGGKPDTMLALYAADGTQLALGDDFAGKQESRVYHDVQATGTYYVVVVAYDGSTTGAYSVSATIDGNP